MSKVWVVTTSTRDGLSTGERGRLGMLGVYTSKKKAQAAVMEDVAGRWDAAEVVAVSNQWEFSESVIINAHQGAASISYKIIAQGLE